MAGVRADLQISQTDKVPVLTYHSIDASGSIVSVAPEVFRRQMSFLSESGYNTVSMSDLVNSLVEKKPISPKTIALTFDDGFHNFYTTAFPILEQCGFKATVFLVTDFCGKTNDWADNPPQLPPSNLLSWREIKELNSCGIEFGAHTRTHPDLTRISAVAATREIVESKAVIEDSLGTTATSFAYPYGRFNRSIRQIAEKTYRSASSTNLGKAARTSDFFALERIDAYYLSNQKTLVSLGTKNFDRYLRFRQTLRDVKSLISRN